MKKGWIFAIIIIVILGFAGYIVYRINEDNNKIQNVFENEEEIIYDGPPNFHEDVPLPENHNGTFVNEKYGSFTFNGDGESIVLDLTEEFAEATGLPAGKSEGRYAFMSSWPPHITEWRYDYAHEFWIIIGEEDEVIFGNISREDGSAEIRTDEEHIALYDNFGFAETLGEEEYIFEKS